MKWKGVVDDTIPSVQLPNVLQNYTTNEPLQNDSWTQLVPGFAAAAQEMMYPLDDALVQMKEEDEDVLLQLLNEQDVLQSSASVVEPLGKSFAEHLNLQSTIQVANQFPIPPLGGSYVISLDPPSNIQVLASRSFGELNESPTSTQQQKQPQLESLSREELKRMKNKLIAKRNREKARTYKESLEQESKMIDEELLNVKSQLIDARRAEKDQRLRKEYLLAVLKHDKALAALIGQLPSLRSDRGGGGVRLSTCHFARQDRQAEGAGFGNASTAGFCLHVKSIESPVTLKLCCHCAYRNSHLTSTTQSIT